jgi:hypothetical protein
MARQPIGRQRPSENVDRRELSLWLQNAVLSQIWLTSDECPGFLPACGDAVAHAGYAGLGEARNTEFS